MFAWLRTSSGIDRATDYVESTKLDVDVWSAEGSRGRWLIAERSA
jgi:hypothetical protein